MNQSGYYYQWGEWSLLTTVIYFAVLIGVASLLVRWVDSKLFPMFLQEEQEVIVRGSPIGRPHESKKKPLKAALSRAMARVLSIACALLISMAGVFVAQLTASAYSSLLRQDIDIEGESEAICEWLFLNHQFEVSYSATVGLAGAIIKTERVEQLPPAVRQWFPPARTIATVIDGEDRYIMRSEHGVWNVVNAEGIPEKASTAPAPTTVYFEGMEGPFTASSPEEMAALACSRENPLGIGNG